MSFIPNMLLAFVFLLLGATISKDFYMWAGVNLFISLIFAVKDGQ